MLFSACARSLEPERLGHGKRFPAEADRLLGLIRGGAEPREGAQHVRLLPRGRLTGEQRHGALEPRKGVHEIALPERKLG